MNNRYDSEVLWHPRRRSVSPLEEKARHSLRPEVVAVIERVKKQLEVLRRPFKNPERFVRDPGKIEDRTNAHVALPTVEYYKRLDPFWLSTMGGEFAGRVLGT